MQFQSRKADLAVFKERAQALQQAVDILEEGIAASRSQVRAAYSTNGMPKQYVSPLGSALFLEILQAPATHADTHECCTVKPLRWPYAVG